MTTIRFRINEDLHILRMMTYNPATKSNDVKKENIDTEIQVTFKCLKGAEHYPFIESLYKSAPPAWMKNQNRTIQSPKTTTVGFIFQLTRVVFEINTDSYLIERLIYNPATKAFKITTERVGDWEKLFSSTLKSQSNTFLWKAST